MNKWRKRYLQDLYASGVLLGFSAGSIACKSLIFSRNYPQRLNPLTQVHATKIDLYTIDSTWMEEGMKMKCFYFILSSMIQSSLCSIDLVQCLAILYSKFYIFEISEWMHEYMKLVNERINNPEIYLKSFKHQDLFFCLWDVLGKANYSSLAGTIQRFQECFLCTSRWQSLYTSHFSLTQIKGSKGWKKKERGMET